MCGVDNHTRFTEGDCHILAHEIHKLTGWPICAFESDGLPDLHVYALHGNRLVDIEGAHTYPAAKKKWSSRTISQWDWQSFVGPWGDEVFEGSRERAQELAPQIVASVLAGCYNGFDD